MIKSIVFGGCSGFGESILLKYGNNEYGIIDSFIDRKSGNPSVLDYISLNNIAYDDIKFVILTHFHQDHFTGIATILEKCKKAKFYTSKSIVSSDFQFLIAAYSSINSSYNFFSEFEKVIREIRNSKRKIFALSEESTPLIETPLVKIYSLSPNGQTVEFLNNIYKKRAEKLIDDKGIRIQIGQEFNFQSVVIVAEINTANLLFGSDLEYSKSNKEIGWSTVCENPKIADKKFNIFKLPHHGSENGCDINDWERLVVDNAYLKLTPYCRSRLPRPEMIEKICKLSSEAYITSEIKTAKIPSKFSKKLIGLSIRKIKDSAGYIELNADPALSKVNVVLGGNAKKLP